jgi:hypothetical protein
MALENARSARLIIDDKLFFVAMQFSLYVRPELAGEPAGAPVEHRNHGAADRESYTAIGARIIDIGKGSGAECPEYVLECETFSSTVSPDNEPLLERI